MSVVGSTDGLGWGRGEIGCAVVMMGGGRVYGYIGAGMRDGCIATANC